MTFLRALCICVAMIFAAAWPAVARAAVTVWNYDVLGDPYKVTDPQPVSAITITATRNGTFSGAVAVGSPTAFGGLQASVTALSMSGATIPASQIAVRYAVSWGPMGGGPDGLDVLLKRRRHRFRSSTNARSPACG